MKTIKIEKKQCYFTAHNIQHIDYKDVELLRKFLAPSGKLLPRKRTGTSTKHQRALALAVKRARSLGLLPYIAT
jgi:small subunit ribosomal protein S18